MKLQHLRAWAVVLSTVVGMGWAGGASAQGCSCANASLIGTPASVNYSGGPSGNNWNGTVTTAVEMPSNMPTPPWWMNPGRYNVDIQATSIRLEFARAATYGVGAHLNFTLNPNCPAAKIVSVTFTTNRPDAAPYVTTASSFGTPVNSVKVAYGNQGGSMPFADWQQGDWIEAQIKFGCAVESLPESTCCPPVTKALVKGMFKHLGNSASTYTEPLDTGSTATAGFVNGLKAYLAYVKFICPQITSLRAEFFTGPVTAPSGSGPAGPLTGADLSTPKSTALITPSTNAVVLNAALSPPGGMNTYVHNDGQYYRISVRITGVDAQGKVVNCGFNAAECALDDSFGFVYTTAGRTAPSQAPVTD